MEKIVREDIWTYGQERVSPNLLTLQQHKHWIPIYVYNNSSDRYHVYKIFVVICLKYERDFGKWQELCICDLAPRIQYIASRLCLLQGIV